MITDKLIIAFSENTEKKITKSGRVEMHCKKGLWGVDAPTEDEAEKEALHYFMQYYNEGEY